MTGDDVIKRLRSLYSIAVLVAIVISSCTTTTKMEPAQSLSKEQTIVFGKVIATALRELKPLAEQGHADAQFNLGQMYYNGEGVPQDDKTAVKLFRPAFPKYR